MISISSLWSGISEGFLWHDGKTQVTSTWKLKRTTEALYLRWHFFFPQVSWGFALRWQKTTSNQRRFHLAHSSPAPRQPDSAVPWGLAKPDRPGGGCTDKKHGKLACAELPALQRRCCCRCPGQGSYWHILLLQLQTDVFTAIREAAETPSMGRKKKKQQTNQKQSPKKAATFISPKQCNAGIFCCPLQWYFCCCFGLWQATVLGEASHSRMVLAQWGKMLSALAKLKTFLFSSRPSRNTAKPQTLLTIWITDCKTWSTNGKHLAFSYPWEWLGPCCFEHSHYGLFWEDKK